MSPRFLVEGCCRALAHAFRLAADATTLFEARRYSSTFVLTVSAREELGRANILWKHSTDAGNHQNLKQQLNDHASKLNAGQLTTFYPLPKAMREEFARAIAVQDRDALDRLHAERRSIATRKRKGDPQRTHRRRLIAQYVNMNKNSWDDPIETTRDETRDLLMTVLTEIADMVRLLLEAEGEMMREVCNPRGIVVPSDHQLLSLMSSL